MEIIEHSLKYLRESLSNYVEEDDICEQICLKLDSDDFETEIDFIEVLNDEELDYLDSILEKEINYAQTSQDEVREKELKEIYEVLF